MADEKDKIEEAVETAPDQVELVGEAKKAEAEVVEALPKVEEASVPQAAKTDAKPSKTPKGYKPRLKADYEDRIVKAMPKEGKVIVSGVNVHARHRKPTQLNPQGGIERKEAPLHVSKVAIATADGKPSRVRFEVRDGKKVRVAAKTGELIHG